MRGAAWRLRRLPPPGPEPWHRLAEAWGLSAPAARLAWMRGADQPADLAWRLDPAWSRSTDPHLLSGMGEAVARIRRAVAQGEPITVYGDYDVDGVSATAVLLRTLERMQARVEAFIPNRFSDGYGLNLDCIRELVARRGPGLAVSVDCGVRSSEEVRASRELGLEWVLTDHHLPGDEGLPEACAVVHPALGDYPNPHLAGVGVAFKLAQALLDAVPQPRGADVPFLDGLLKLVALGTLADQVPLIGENALLVRRGLQALAGPNAPGLAALLAVARVEGMPSAQAVAFHVAPRLNAAGRMGGAQEALDLLLSRDAGAAADLAERVDALNRERRKIQAELAASLPEAGPGAFDFVLSEQAHKGVIGIVAAQRSRSHGRPSGVGTLLDGLVHASLRAPEGFDLTDMIARARPFLRSGGGHRGAAGITFEPARLGLVQRSLMCAAEEQAQASGPTLPLLDGQGGGVVPGAAELARLEPWGQGFPLPSVLLEGVAGPVQAFGEGHHRHRLAGLSESLTWFAGAQLEAPPAAGQRIRVIASPMDHPRFGRSWRVEASLPGEAP